MWENKHYFLIGLKTIGSWSKDMLWLLMQILCCCAVGFLICNVTGYLLVTHHQTLVLGDPILPDSYYVRVSILALVGAANIAIVALIIAVVAGILIGCYGLIVAIGKHESSPLERT